MDIREKIRKWIERLEAQRECAEFFNECDSVRKYGFAIRVEKTLEEPQDEAGGEMPRTRAYCGDMCPSCGGVIESRRVTQKQFQGLRCIDCGHKFRQPKRERGG